MKGKGVKLFQSTNALSLVVIAVLILAAYSFALSAPFKSLDDEAAIVNNAAVKSLNVKAIFKSAFFGHDQFYRPLISVGHALEYGLYGLNPAGFILTNILLHILNTILVFYLLQRLLPATRLALAAAVVFAIHPIQVEAVANIAGRSNLFSALFILAAFNAFLKNEIGSKWWLVLSGICFGAGLLSKESAAVFVLVLCAYMLFLRNPGEKGSVGKLAPFFAVTFLFVIFRRWLGLLSFWETRDVAQIFTQFAAFLKGVLVYVKLIVFPTDIYFDRAERVLALSDPGLWLTISAWIFLAAILIISRKRLSPTAKFLIVWFFIELIPVSQLIRSVGVQRGFVSTAEHFFYLASVPFLGLVALSLKPLLETMGAWHKRHYLIFLWLVFIYMLTINQAVLSSNPIIQLKKSIDHNPHNARVLYALGHEFAKRGRFKSAEMYFRQAVKSDPTATFAAIGLGKLLCDQGQLLECAAAYEEVSNPGKFTVLLEHNKKAAYRLIIQSYEQKLKTNPDSSQIYYSIGVVYAKMGEPAMAQEHYKKSLELNPENVYALYNMANLEIYFGNVNGALPLLVRALELGGLNEQAQYQAQRILQQLNNNVSVSDSKK